MPRNPLVVHRSEWDRLKVQVNANKGLSTSEEQTAYVNALNEASNEMTRKWDNSYESVLQRQEDERIAKKKAEDDSRMNFYRDLLARKNREREQMLAEARYSFFQQKDEPKTLESALRCSEVLREQKTQRQFNEQLRKEEKEREKLHSEEIKKNADDWNETQKKKRERRREVNREVANIIIAQDKERKNREANKRHQEIQAETQDFDNIHDEMEAIRKFEAEFKLKERRVIEKQGSEAIRVRKNKKEEERVNGQLEDKLIGIWELTNCKIKNLTQQRKQEIVDQKTRIRNTLKKNYPDLLKKRLEIEERNYLRAREEIEKREIAFDENTKEKKCNSKLAQKKLFEDWQTKDAERRKNEATLTAWEIANRFENSQHTEQYEEHMREMKKKNIEEYKAFILKQKSDVDAEKKRQEDELYNFYHTERLAEFDAADKKFIKYATDLVEECEEFNRPIYPLVKVIEDYKSKYMNPPKALPKHLKTHFPPTGKKDLERIVKKGMRPENTDNNLEKHPEMREARDCPCKNGL